MKHSGDLSQSCAKLIHDSKLSRIHDPKNIPGSIKELNTQTPRALARVNVHPKTIQLISNMYTDCRTNIRYGNITTESISMTRGVKQGDSLSPEFSTSSWTNCSIAWATRSAFLSITPETLRWHSRTILWSWRQRNSKHNTWSTTRALFLPGAALAEMWVNARP